MKRKIKWGIVGCGAISKAHCDALKVVDNAELYAVYDYIPEMAERRAVEYGGAKVFTEYSEMLADPELEAVSICTPSGMHGEMCKAAADAGKHILCEKPMEITAEGMTSLIERVESSGVKMGCVFQRRYDSKFIAVKQAIDSGRFGKVILADAFLKYYRSDEYYKSAGWRATWELDGGGALMNQGIHGIDLLTWIAGDVESVFARCKTFVRDIPVEDTAIASVQFKNGAIGNITATTSVYPAQDTRLEIHCEKGTIIVSDAGILTWAIEGSDEVAPKIEELKFEMKDDPTKLPQTSHVIPMTDMADAILLNHNPNVTPREARKAVDLILAMYKSSYEQREVWL